LNFGLALNVAAFPRVIGTVAIAVVLTFALNVVSGLVIARLHGFRAPEGLNAAAILVNRGEFTLILATLSVAAGLDSRLTPFAGLYVLIMAVLGPLFAANSERIGAVLLRGRRPVPHKTNSPIQDEEIALVEAATAGQRAGDEDEDGEEDQQTRDAIDRVVEEAMRQAGSDPKRKQN
jgi:CPA2 family monovalent cation:H+ antiporter-2